MKRVILSVIALLSSFSVLAQECENVIALSKLRNTVVQDNQEVKNHSTNFCKEYSKSAENNRSKSFGASYKFLSASFGSNGASMEEVASKYCSSTNIYSASKDAYKEYIENIAPGAYGAYQQCITMSEQNIKFNVDAGSILPTEFTVSASFVSDAVADQNATLSFSSSEDVKCNWNDEAKSKKTLKSGSSGLLKCKRKSHKRKSYVTIVNTSSSDLPLTLPWQAYDDNGIPINNLVAIEEKVDAIKNDINKLESNIVNHSSSITQLNGAHSSLLSVVNSQIRFKWKKGNNGTASCNTYCGDSNWEGFSGACIAAVINKNDTVDCSKVSKGPTHCLCSSR